MQSMGKFRTDLALEAADTSDKKLPEGVFVRENKKDAFCRRLWKSKTRRQPSASSGRPGSTGRGRRR